ISYRSTSQDNVKQLTLAVANYESVFGVIPPTPVINLGDYILSNPALQQRTILPFIESNTKIFTHPADPSNTGRYL
ncbi:DUF1559 domain-containing protein, partial [Salmonella enterica]|nr:DUF1559 domain-containing protein [Salmonella enterica]